MKLTLTIDPVSSDSCSNLWCLGSFRWTVTLQDQGSTQGLDAMLGTGVTDSRVEAFHRARASLTEALVQVESWLSSRDDVDEDSLQSAHRPMGACCVS